MNRNFFSSPPMPIPRPVMTTRADYAIQITASQFSYKPRDAPANAAQGSNCEFQKRYKLAPKLL